MPFAYSTGLASLDQLLNPGIPCDSVVQFWSDVSGIGLTALAFSIARSITHESHKVYFLSTEGREGPFKYFGFSEKSTSNANEWFTFLGINYLEELEFIIQKIIHEPAAIIIDGINRLPVTNPRVMRDNGSSTRETNLEDEASSYAKNLQSNKLLLEIMHLLRARSRKLGLPAIVTNGNQGFYSSCTYKIGSAPDHEPAIFRNSDYSIELIPWPSANPPFQRVIFHGHRNARLYGKEIAVDWPPFYRIRSHRTVQERYNNVLFLNIPGQGEAHD